MKTITNSQFADLYEGIDFYRMTGNDGVSNLKAAGKNLKGVLILMEDVLTAEERELLVKILVALGLTPDDIVIVSFVEKKYSGFSFLKANFKFEKLIGFGVSSANISINVAAGLNKIFTVQETEMLFSHSLKSLSEDENKKKALWKALKTMFEVKNV